MQTMVIEFARNVCGLEQADSTEFNREYEERLTASGLRITGETPDQTYVEICEIPEHPWMLGCQFHLEFKSKPLEPHPLFKAFIGAAYLL
jgi:CTP synthase